MVNVIRFLDLSIILVFTSIVCLSDGKRPDTLLCADPECKGIVSMGKTLLTYSAGDNDMISFQTNKDVRILGKSKDGKILKISYQGRDGFAPANMIRELKMVAKSKDIREVKDLAEETPIQTVAENLSELPNQVTGTPYVVAAKNEDELKPDSTEKSEDMVKVKDLAVETPTETVAENSTELPNQVTDTPPIVADKKDDEIKPDQTVEMEKVEATNGKNLEVDEEENLVEVMDEDEALELEMKGREPVVEEPVIKKYAYKVGETSAAVQPELDVVGLEADVSENKILEKKTEPVLTESAPATIENVSNENTNSIDVNEEKFSANSEPDIAPTTPIQYPMESDAENISLANIEPSETIQGNLSADNVSIKLEDNIVEYDGTKIDTNLLENNIEATAYENINAPPILKKTTVIPTPVVEQKFDSVLEEAQTGVDSNETIESMMISPTSVPPISTQLESKDTNVNVPEHPEIQNQSTATELPLLVDTIDSSSNESIADENVVDGKTDDIAASVIDVLDETIKIEENVTLKQEESMPSAPILMETVPLFSSPQQPDIHVDDVKSQRKLQENVELSIDSEPNIIDGTQTKEPIESFTLSPDLVQETFGEKSQQTEKIPIPVTSESPVIDVEKEKEMPIVDNNSDPNDIFSSSYKPETSNAITETDQGNWYDGILIGFEKIYASVSGLFSSKLSDAQPPPLVSESHHAAHVDTVPVDNHCEKLEDGSCPKQVPTSHQCNNFECLSNLKNLNYDQYADEFLKKIIAMSDVIFLLTFTGFCVLLFTLGHYWLANNRREKELIFKMNNIERNLLKAEKECSAVKEDLLETRKKLARIADKSFGTDDMIRQCENEKAELREQIGSLKEELETAAEAGLELNKMVSELLNNQSGSDSIISSVEELQRQLNEQEEATVYINNLLAEKSRENSELQVMLNECNQKFSTEIEELLQSNESLKSDKENLETELKETMHALEKELNADLEEKSQEINQLKVINNDLQRKYEEITSRWHMSTARAEALEDSIKNIKELNGKEIKTVIEITNANAKLMAAQKESESLKEELENEIDNKRRLEEQIKLINHEITNLRADFNQNEKDKLEAQTRLDVLSSYFKEKEAQLQKELSVKEALFMKQQGESTSTVERVRNLQDEIQGLRSQNDQLRAEIEAQSAAHKAQINAAESRAHDSWLATKQAERRLEEAKIEAAVLRKRLTTLSLSPGVPENSLQTQPHSLDGMMAHDAPSPIHMETPGSPLMSLPVFLPPPPLIGSNPSAFMHGPPPPLIPLPTHGEMRPAPLGRLMSPPPNNYVDDRGRYSPHRYSPDSRYGDDYSRNLYETETDFSPPRSPEPYRRERNTFRERNNRDYSPSPPPQHQHIKRSSLGKGSVSSGSVEQPPQKHQGGKV